MRCGKVMKFPCHSFAMVRYMQIISSRKNSIVRRFIDLAKSPSTRRNEREYVCDGQSLLKEAIEFGCAVKTVLWKETADFELPEGIEQFIAKADVFEYASPLVDSRGPLFTVAMPDMPETIGGGRVIALENVQDPGNVGTVIRTANALGFETVILVSNCADLYNPKTIRATMGAIFRQHVLRMSIDELKPALAEAGLLLCGAALTDNAADLRDIDIKKYCPIIGSEGRGLSREMLDICDREIIIPMRENSESLNAAVAAAIIMWESARA